MRCTFLERGDILVARMPDALYNPTGGDEHPIDVLAGLFFRFLRGHEGGSGIMTLP